MVLTRCKQHNGKLLCAPAATLATPHACAPHWFANSSRAARGRTAVNWRARAVHLPPQAHISWNNNTLYVSPKTKACAFDAHLPSVTTCLCHAVACDTFHHLPPPLYCNCLILTTSALCYAAVSLMRPHAHPARLLVLLRALWLTAEHLSHSAGSRATLAGLDVTHAVFRHTSRQQRSRGWR